VFAAVPIIIPNGCSYSVLIESANKMNQDHKIQSDQYLGLEYLARESHKSIDVVAQLYGKELEKLSIGARIKTFIPILALRNVRKILGQRPTGKTLTLGRT